MKSLLSATVFACLCTISASSEADTIQKVINLVTNPTCGVPNHVVSSLRAKERGPVDGGYDENGDGKVDYVEAFTMWDYAQTLSTINSGIEHQTYTWTNIDTCYKFYLTPMDFFEDETQPILWQTCRRFALNVIDQDGNHIGGNLNHVGCRNFGTREWTII
jgi:hypothetical protein